MNTEETKTLVECLKIAKKVSFQFYCKNKKKLQEKKKKNGKNRLQTDVWYVVKVRRLFW